MAIYAKKNARGQPTGKWLVEVTTQGKRRRATADTMIEAKRMEASLKLQEHVPALQATNLADPSVYTIGKLRKEARAVWRGNKDERQSIQRFDTCCDILGDTTDIKAVRTKQLDYLKEALIERGLQPATAHRYMASMSAALRWAHERDLIVGMPHVPWPEQGKGREDIISEEDQKRTLAWMQSNGYEDVLLVYEVLLATGMRIGELLGLSQWDISPGDQTVTLRDTKNGDDRTVPLGHDLAFILQTYIREGRLPSYRRINTAAHKAQAALGISHSITPHVMRHTLVTRLEAADVGLKTIGQLVGHRSIRTTAKYAHPRVETLRQAVGRLKP